MQSEIIISIIAFFGTLVGSLGGILASSKLTNHRIEKLEKKVDEHNCIVSRTYVLEQKIEHINANMEIIHKRIDSVKKGENK